MNWYDSGDQLTKKELEQFEKEIGFLLPSDYKDFMIGINGGTPEDDLTYDFVDVITGQKNTSDLRELFVFYLDDNDNYDDIIRIYQCMVKEQTIPACFFPIGDDSGGNPICIDLSDDGFGVVYFCDHEMENKETSYLPASKIADGFADFLNKLHIFTQ